MLINPINNFKYNLYNKNDISFSGQKKSFLAPKSWQVLDITGDKVLNRHTSCYFRNDLNWLELGNYLKEKFNNKDKVNTYIWGCSSGYEAYSLSMLLDKVFNKDKTKFFPIEAMDISFDIIAEALSRQESNVLVNNTDYFRIKDGLKLSPYEVWKYIEFCDDEEFSKLEPEIVKSVNFSCSNIVDDLDKIKNDNPSIVMCRNMWPYINPERYNECAKKMYENLKKGSVVIIGDFDLEGEPYIEGSDTIQNYLIKSGLKPKNVARNKSKYFTYWQVPCYIYEKN